MKLYGDVMPFTEELEVYETEDNDVRLYIKNDETRGVIYLNKNKLKILIDELSSIYDNIK